MKYSVRNRLSDFEFHDAEFFLRHYENGNLCVTVKHLNLHKGVQENPHDFDMEISDAVLTFEDVRVRSFEPMRNYVLDDYSNWHTNEPRVVFRGKKAEAHFIEALRSGAAINCLKIRKRIGKKVFDFSTSGKLCFFAAFSFKDAVIEWDEYCQKAWYELW